MPRSAHQVSMVLYNDLIVYTGFDLGVYKYNIEHNRHQKVLDLKEDNWKLVINGGDRVYVIENHGYIYSSSDAITWDKLHETSINFGHEATVGCRVLIENSVYFTTDFNYVKLYKFDLGSKNVELVKEYS